MILSAAYMLYLYRRVVFGVITHADLRGMLDLEPREIAIFAPMIAIVLWMGIYPASFLRPMQPTIANLIAHVQVTQRAHAAAGAVASLAAARQ
jgi:NADH-quinone oxidoreductase subunit M